MDFLDSLKEIKGQMAKSDSAKTTKPAKANPNRDEFRDIFKEPEIENASELTPEEFKAKKSARLRDEFSEFVKFADVKKLD